MRRFLALILVLFLAVVFALPASNSVAAPAKKVVKIGDIVSFNGAVLIRTKGTWGRLRKTPHPIFSSDKIVTKRGRAQVRFVDGGVMRVNVDSNVSIVQRVEMKGFFTKRAVTSRVVNVLVGDVWFDVKVTRDRKVTFRTPSMTAAIRGTSGNISTLLDAVSSFGLSSGSAETSGSFQEIVESLIKELEMAGTLPPSNPSIQKSPMMKAAEDAMLAHSEAASSSAKAKDQTGKAQGIAKDASTDSPEEVLAASQLRAIAAVVTAAAAANEASAQVEVSQEALLEAQRMGDDDAAAQAQANLEIAQGSLDMAREQITVTRQIAEVVSETDNAAQAAAGAAQAVAASSVASASASTATAVTQATIAELSGNTEAIELANKQIQATQDAVALAETQQERAEEIAKLVEADPEASLEVVVAATSAVSSASETIAISAEAQANVATQAASGDTASLETAQDAATQLKQMADTVDAATATIVVVVSTNDLEEAKKIGDATGDAYDS
ncbi:MAG TPA: hypothetical protein ENI12_02585, partial [Nitrospirae bacterium]|nr:hypothetical protein [Nitrospirota bacterium]